MLNDSFQIHCIVMLIRMHYLRNRKRVASVYGGIMHAGNVRRIREKRVNCV